MEADVSVNYHSHDPFIENVPGEHQDATLHI